MSVNLVNKSDGSLSKVAGKIASGTLVPSVSYYQSGRTTNTAALNATQSRQTFNLSEEMPDTDYVVVINPSYAINCNVETKTKTSFTCVLYADNNYGNIESGKCVFQWQAFKLMTDENRVLDETAIAQNTSDISDLQDDKQDKTLETSLTIGGTSRTTVEGALGGLNTEKVDKVSSATAGDIATLDTDGNLVDSGISKNVIPNSANAENPLITKSQWNTNRTKNYFGTPILFTGYQAGSTHTMLETLSKLNEKGYIINGYNDVKFSFQYYVNGSFILSDIGNVGLWDVRSLEFVGNYNVSNNTSFVIKIYRQDGTIYIGTSNDGTKITWATELKTSDLTTLSTSTPSTSNKLITQTTAKDYLTNLGWGSFSGSTIGESVITGVNSLLISVDVTRSYMLRGTYPALGYWQAFISPPRTPSGHMWQAFVQYERIGIDSHTSRGLYVVEFSYNSSADAGSQFTLVNESSVVKSSDLTSTVTSGSTAPITSGGVYSALKKHRICIPWKSNGDTELVTSSAGATGSVALAWDTWLKSNISFGKAIRYRFIFTGTCNSGTATIKFGSASADLATLSLTANSNATEFNRPYATNWISNEIGANIYMYKSTGSGKVTWSELSVEIEYTET